METIIVDVFAERPFAGNQLAVVRNAGALDTAQMQAIALETNFSETTFVIDEGDGHASVRIFTPTSELPFAGHPLVGITWVLHRLGPGGPSQIECGIGPVSIGMDGDVAWVDAPLNQRVNPSADLDGYLPGSVPVSVTTVEMPVPYHVVELSDVASVASAPVAGSGMVFVFCRTGPDSVHGRFFAPDAGVPEDPATGSAAVALAASRLPVQA